MKLQDIKLENGHEVVIDHNSRRPCIHCGREIMTAVFRMKKIIVELSGFAEWDEHKCRG